MRRFVAFQYLPDREAAQRWTLFILALLALGAGLGLREPWPPDEPRFALIARDMVATGEWLFPKVAGVLYPDKPPFAMWLIAVSYLVTGSMVVAFLLPTLLASVGTVVLVYDLGRRLWNHRSGLAAGGALLVTFQFGLQAKTAQLDALLTFFITLGLYGVLRHALLGPAWGWYAVGGFAAGLGMAVKGVGFLALFVLVPLAWAHWRGWRQLPRLASPFAAWALAPLAMLAGFGAWLVPMLLAVAASQDQSLEAYRDNILFTQSAGRYLHPWHHFQPWWYYFIDVIPAFWLPLSALLPWAVPAWWRRIARSDARQLLLLSYVAFVVLFFTLSPGKRGVYLLPALPALALAFAPLMPGLLAREGVQRAGAAVLALSAFMLAAFPAWVLWVEPHKGVALVARHGIEPWGFFWTLALAAVAWLAWGRVTRGLLAFAGFMLTLWMVYGVYGYPVLDRTRSAQDLMLHAEAELPPDAELGLVDWEEQFVLQARRPVTHFGFRRGGEREEALDGLAWVSAVPERRLLIDAEAIEQNNCVDTTRAASLGYKSRRHWLLVGAEAVVPSCRPALATRTVEAIRAPTP